MIPRPFIPAVVSLFCAAAAIGSELMTVPAGIYRPLFVGENDLKEIPVARFMLAAAPVTNAEFLDFVRANPQWQRSKVKRIFADENYLQHWAGDTELGPRCDAAQPVTWLSWPGPSLLNWVIARVAGRTISRASSGEFACNWEGG